MPGYLLRTHLVLASALLLTRIALGAGDGPRVRDVGGTVHNLSVTGPGTTRALTKEEICKFCHTAHGGSSLGLVYNKPDTPGPFTLYDSPSLDSRPSPPFPESRLCLSCHDGTIALGDLLSEQQIVSFPPGLDFLDPSIGGVEPMLTDDHPISFPYDASLAATDGELATPSTLPPELPLAQGNLECITCHGAHDNTLGFFLRQPWQGGGICESCHTRGGWTLAAHLSIVRPATVPSPSADQLSGCNACHQVHFAQGGPPLLGIATEEAGCYDCHSAGGDAGNPTAADVQSAFSLQYHHPVEVTAGVHQAGEDPFTMLQHVECADCHDPHVARGGTAMDAMDGSPGIDTGGFAVDPAIEPQQVCYRCHGLAPEPVEDVPRLFSGFSVREQFGAAAVSAHPVDRDAQGLSPSLRPAWQSVTRIGCVDCHGSPTGIGVAAGPHGSSFPFLLEREYRVDGTGGFVPADADLCDKCHDVGSITSDSSDNFEHKKHFEKGVLCGSCHAAHGVAGGPSNGTAHLINFDLRVVQPFNGTIQYVQTQPGKGSCTLTCHGEQHDDENY